LLKKRTCFKRPQLHTNQYKETKMTKLHFQVEQIALCPKNPTLARQLLEDLGLSEWFVDNVHAAGYVHGVPGENHALLQFNYQAGSGQDIGAAKPLELELLHYTSGRNWMDRAPNTVSHLGMHVTQEQLDDFRAYFFSKGIGAAQEVFTQGHTNAAIRDERRYNYVIFDTREILGVDLKFIVRIHYSNGPTSEPEPPKRKRRVKAK
jgi:hypothetical protein